MRLQDLPLQAMAELYFLAEKKVDINDPAVKNSIFYQKIQNEVVLDAHWTWNVLSSEGMLLLAKIVANSPSLQSIDMSWNRLGKYGPATAAELAKSPSLQSIDMRNTELGEDGPPPPATAAEIRAHNDAHEINVKLNKDLHETLNPMLIDDIVNIVGDYIIPKTAHITLKF